MVRGGAFDDVRCALKPGGKGDNELVEFESVTAGYPDKPDVLRNVTFRLGHGSFHFLTGPSGAGKTTLMRLLYGALRPTSGTIRMFGNALETLDRDSLPAVRRRIGVIYQDFRLISHLSALENVAMPLRIRGTPRDQIVDDVTELLNWVGLSDRMDTQPASLSGGEQQRVAIARAVIGKPDLILADEPTGNVDPDMGYRIMRLFVELNRLGATIVIATHDHGLIDRFPADTLTIDGGAVHQERRMGRFGFGRRERIA